MNLKKVFLSFILVFTALLGVTTLSANTTSLDSWNYIDNYYVYNQDVMLSDGLSIELSSEIDITSLEYNYNNNGYQSVEMKPDGSFTLFSDITYQPNNIALHEVYINDVLIATLGIDMSLPEKLNITIRALGTPRAQPIERLVTDVKSDFNEWELTMNNGVYFLESNRVSNDTNKLLVSVSTAFKSINETYDSFILDVVDGSTSRVEVYQDNSTIHQKSSHDLRYLNANNRTALHLYGANTEEDIYFDQGDHFKIVLALNKNLTSAQRNEILNAFNHNYRNTNDFVAVIFSVTAYLIPVEIDLIGGDYQALPETEGSIYSDTNKMGKVSISNLGNNQYQFTINYERIYTFVYTFASNTNVSMFDSNFEAFYYSDNGSKFIVFNLGQQSMFTSRNIKNQTFVPYTTWNLNTNELATIDDFNVYLYTKNEAGNNIYAYFYVNDFVIDNLLSVSLAMEWRYVSIVGSKGEWNPYFRTLEQGNVSSGNVSWKLKAAMISSAATAAGSFIPGLGFPILAVGTPVSLLFNYLAVDEMIEKGSMAIGSINEISNVVPTTTLKNEINGAYREYYDNFDGMDLSNYTLWKLHLGTFDKFFQDRVEIRKDNGLDVISFRYMTDGKVYTIDDSNINEVFNPGSLEETPDDKPLAPDWLARLLKFIEENFIGIILASGVAVAVGFVILIVAKIKNEFSSSKRRYRKNKGSNLPGVIIALAIAIAIIILVTSLI